MADQFGTGCWSGTSSYYVLGVFVDCILSFQFLPAFNWKKHPAASHKFYYFTGLLENHRHLLAQHHFSQYIICHMCQYVQHTCSSSLQNLPYDSHWSFSSSLTVTLSLRLWTKLVVPTAVEVLRVEVVVPLDPGSPMGQAGKITVI